MLNILPNSLPLNQTYQSRVVTTMAEFEALADEWALLLANADETNINMDYVWLKSWLELFPCQLFVVLVQNAEGKLVGAAPFKISKSPRGLARKLLRQLQFIGSEPDVYEWMKLVIVPTEDNEAVIREIARQCLAASHLWDTVDLRFCADETQLERLSHYLAPSTFAGDVTTSTAVLYLQLPETIEAYEEASRKRGYKRDLKRVHNHLKRDFPEHSLQLDFIPPSPQAREMMENFCRQHIAYWAGRGSNSDFKRFPNLMEFYLTLHNRFNPAGEAYGRAQFSILRIGNIPLGYQVVFVQKDSFIGHLVTYNAAYRKYRPGILHFEALIHHAIQSGAHWFEFGRGDESYKTQWTQETRPLWSLLIHKSRWTACLWHLDDILKKLLKKTPQ